MKKIILTLAVCLSCIMVANAQYPHVVDTLPKRIVNGLEVIPIKTTYKRGDIFWELEIFDFEKCLQQKNKSWGGINYDLNSDVVNKAIYGWQDKLWEIYPPEIKTLKKFDLKLLIDEDGRVFAVKFSMPDKTFQQLEELPENTLKNFYQILIKEECPVFKEVDFHVWDSNKDSDSPKYTTIELRKYMYDMFATFTPLSMLKKNTKVMDTLPKRVVNGLEVIPVRTTYDSGEICWRFSVSDFEKCFQQFKNKSRGEVYYQLNPDEVNKAIGDWLDKFWEIYPPEIKALKIFDFKLFVDKNGRVFTVEFFMPDEAFQKLESLPENTLKNFYQNLIKEECPAFKEVDFHDLNSNRGSDSSEYTTIWLRKSTYDIFGTFNPK